MDGATATLVVGFLTLVATAVAIVVTVYIGGRPERIERSQRAFRAARHHLKQERAPLARAARLLYPSVSRDDLPLLFDVDWLPAEPLDLASVHVEAHELESEVALLSSLTSQLPRTQAHGRYRTYADAVGELIVARSPAPTEGPPPQFENRVCYRLMAVSPGSGAWNLRVSKTHYFDMLNTCEAVGFEYAAADLDARGADHSAKTVHKMGPGRRQTGGPFQLDRRCVVPGINTLTIRSDGAETGFFMHRRGQVATAMGTTHVIPAGEFQPAGVDPTSFAEDADIWRTIVRESAEELLGYPEAAGESGVTIDYDRDEPYCWINRARRSGGCWVRFLGIGIDPLSLKAEVLTVSVFKADVFDKIFRQALIAMKSRNMEGEILTGRDYKGIPFDFKNVQTFLSEGNETLPAGAACLALAWQWRDFILKPPPRRQSLPRVNHQVGVRSRLSG